MTITNSQRVLGQQAWDRRLFDPETVHADLKDILSPSQTRRFVRFFSTLNHNSDSDWAPIHHWENESVSSLQTLAEVFKMSEKWGRRDPKPHALIRNFNSSRNQNSDARRELMRLAHALEYRDGLELMRKIGPRQQALILNEAQILRKPNTYGLLNLIVKTGIPINKIYMEMIHYRVLTYWSKFESCARKSPKSYTLYLGEPSDKFIRLILEPTMRAYDASDHAESMRIQTLMKLHSLKPTLLFLMRALYGEEKVIEGIDRLSELDQTFEIDEIIDILDNWDTLKDYPADWIVEYMCYSQYHENRRGLID